MAYQVQNGNVIEWTVKCNLYGQTCLMVNHFRASPLWAARDALDTFDAMNDDLRNGVGHFRDLLIAATSTDLSIEAFIFQLIYPLRYARVVYGLEDHGTQAGTAGTANTAAVLTKYTELSSDRAGGSHKGQVGSMHIPGIPAANLVAGLLNPDYRVASIQPIADNLVADWTDATLTEMDYVLFHRNSNPPSADVITEVIVQPTVRTMRTRTVGKGV